MESDQTIINNLKDDLKSKSIELPICPIQEKSLPDKLELSKQACISCLTYMESSSPYTIQILKIC